LNLTALYKTYLTGKERNDVIENAKIPDVQEHIMHEITLWPKELLLEAKRSPPLFKDI